MFIFICKIIASVAVNVVAASTSFELLLLFIHNDQDDGNNDDNAVKENSPPPVDKAELVDNIVALVPPIVSAASRLCRRRCNISNDDGTDSVVGYVKADTPIILLGDDNDDDDDDDSSSQGSAAASSTAASSTATTQYHEILNLDDYTEQEKQNCWYTRRGYFEIRDRVKLELSLYLLDKNTNDGVVADDDEYCVRGLERRTYTAKTLRHTTRSQAVHAVLYEMECQKHNGYMNQNMVADVYREYSIPSAKIAQTIAHQDKMDANPR
mmetsp:Transcript_30134/g.34201  ORF Transcript_30134/g.34201 Transcript_30134/m.34201 type:complete len:267 (-) Transcript_30134:56-856(-)